MNLTDKVAIVTGAASGSGAEIARFFAQQGAMVVVSDIDLAGVNAICAEIGSSALAFRCDVTRRDQVEQLLAACVREFDVPDVVVNCAGVTPPVQSILEGDERDYDNVFSVHLKAIFHMARAVVPPMRQRGSGVILNLGASAASGPRAGSIWSDVAKGAVSLLSRTLAVELAADGIRVNAICPLTEDRDRPTEWTGARQSVQERLRLAMSSIPPGQLSHFSAVARVAAYLASDDASFVTGMAFPIAAGRSVQVFEH